MPSSLPRRISDSIAKRPTLDKSFLDTNVIIYLFGEDSEKKSLAKKAANESGACISLQVVNEFCGHLLKKKYPHDTVLAAVNQISENFPILKLSEKTIREALRLGKRYRYSHFDCLHLAAAIEHGCRVFYSEDMQHGHKLEEGLRIINPFVGHG